MLIALTQILGSSIYATDDNNVGSAKDLFFDGDTWDVRYIVIDTGKWLPGKHVLLTPADVNRADWGRKQFSVRQTKDQVKNAPHVDEDKPVSRQMESELAAYYGWPAYWEGGAVMGAPAPVMVERPAATPEHVAVAKSHQDGDPHLRSFKQVKGYNVAASDGDIGSVTDAIVDDDKWTVRYLIIDTGNWLPGRQVLVSPQWVDEIIWLDRRVVTTMTQAAVKNSPEFEPHAAVNRQYEEQLYDYYGKKKYW